MKKNKLLGFTLAEVLIVITILGIIAVMVIPTTIQKYKIKKTVVQLKATQLLFDNAYKLALMENGRIENWGITTLEIIQLPDKPGTVYVDTPNDEESSRILFQNITKHLKLAKTCKPDDNSCIVILEASALGNYIHKIYSGVLINGVSFHMFTRDVDCRVDNICADITVDLNGMKKPNKWGEDIFRFTITPDKILPRGLPTDTRYTFKRTCNPAIDNGQTAGFGEGCASWVIQNENTDYWKCQRVLNWDSKKSCK